MGKTTQKCITKLVTVIALSSSNLLSFSRSRDFFTPQQNENKELFTNEQKLELGKLIYRSHSNRNNPNGVSISAAEMDSISLPGSNTSNNNLFSNFNSFNKLKSGYCHPLWQWTDDNFIYDKYAFESTNQSVASPFYFYPHLPGYLLVGGDTGIGSSGKISDFKFHHSEHYPLNPSQLNKSDDELQMVDQCIKHICLAFKNSNPRLLATYMPTEEFINILVDGSLSYSISGDSLWTIFADACYATSNSQYSCLKANVGFYAENRKMPSILQAYKTYTDYKAQKAKEAEGQKAIAQDENTQNMFNIFSSVVKAVAPKAVTTAPTPPTAVEPNSIQLVFVHNYTDAWKKNMANYHIWTFEFNTSEIPKLKTFITTRQNPFNNNGYR